jgi:hypothetical protein
MAYEDIPDLSLLRFPVTITTFNAWHYMWSSWARSGRERAVVHLDRGVAVLLFYGRFSSSERTQSTGELGLKLFGYLK